LIILPHESWTGKKPALVLFIFFGCDAHVHVSKEKRRKLGKKVDKCIFIGYKYGVKGYKLWDPTIRKTIYSSDVIFRQV
jgi:hypothetical protein